jgi:hypothetical protein
VNYTNFRFKVIAPGYFNAPGSTITFSLSQRSGNLYLSQHGETTGENNLGHFAYAAGLSGLTWDRQAVNLASVLDPQYPDPETGPTPSPPLGPPGSPQPDPTVAPGG